MSAQYFFMIITLLFSLWGPACNFLFSEWLWSATEAKLSAYGNYHNSCSYLMTEIFLITEQKETVILCLN